MKDTEQYACKKKVNIEYDLMDLLRNRHIVEPELKPWCIKVKIIL